MYRSYVKRRQIRTPIFRIADQISHSKLLKTASVYVSNDFYESHQQFMQSASRKRNQHEEFGIPRRGDPRDRGQETETENERSNGKNQINQFNCIKIAAQ